MFLMKTWKKQLMRCMSKKMKRIRLTKEEKEIEDSLMREEYVKVTGAELQEISSSLAARKKALEEAEKNIRYSWFGIFRSKRRIKHE